MWQLCLTVEWAAIGQAACNLQDEQQVAGKHMQQDLQPMLASE
jgi:hypothetical protein